MRVLRERDEMQNMVDKYERRLSEIQANVKVLTGERDKTSMHYQQAQEEIATLRREVLKSKSSRATKGTVTAQSILKRVEVERDESMADLYRMSNERDSLRERLKICQETAISERAHLEQRVEDLQSTILMLEQERGDQRSRMAQMRETMLGLEEEVDALSQRLADVQEEVVRSRHDCGTLRLSNNQAENALIDSQRRLTSRIGELQNVQERNKMLDEKNDSLLRQVSGLREEVASLQATIDNWDQDKDLLRDQLDQKTDLLNIAHVQLDDKEALLRSLRITIDEFEAAHKSRRENTEDQEREVEAVRRRLDAASAELSATIEVKEATLRENALLREDLDRAGLDSQTLQRRAEDCTHEVVDLQRKVQDYVSDVARVETLLSTKERECRELQDARRRTAAQAGSWEDQARHAEGAAAELRLELADSEVERRRLREKAEALEASLQEALSAERSSSGQLSQLSRSLKQTEEELRDLQEERCSSQIDLDKTRELCVKLDASKEAAQGELEAYRSELELLHKQLASERLSLQSLESLLVATREKELQRQLGAQESSAQAQLLRDKLSLADSKASCHLREVCQLRTRSAQLEADLEMTKRQLSTERFERERAVQELRRQGLSSSSSPRLSASPRVSWSPERPPYRHSPPDRLAAERRSPDRWAPRSARLKTRPPFANCPSLDLRQR
ncbi:testis-specific gene 10 protein [Aplochiton taeniatus]